MYLQLSSGAADSRGGVSYRRRIKNENSTSSTTPQKYSSRRSYKPSPTIPCAGVGIRAKEDVGDGELSMTLSSRSPPPSPLSSVLPGKASCGVFLACCKASGDFLQLPTDSSSSNSSSLVRLYLTATELVKKITVRNGCTAPDGGGDPAKRSTRDFTISRYPLEDVEVSASRVSRETMLVSISSISLVDASPKHAAMHDRASTTASTIRASRGVNDLRMITTTSAAKGCNYEYRNGMVGACPPVIEAYQLLPGTGGQGSIEDWISQVNENKRKLAMRHKLKTNSRLNSTATDGTCYHNNFCHSPTRVASPTRPTTIAVSNKSGRTRRPEVEPFRRSISGYDFPSQSLNSPTRGKLPTTSNGKYTPLHHHYSPHPLFSNSPPANSRHVRQRRHGAEKDPFRLFRRLSLGGGSGTYRFPSPPNDMTGKSPVHGGTQGSSDGKSKSGTYMYSLEGQGVEVTENHVVPSKITSPFTSPVPTRRSDAVSPQQAPHHDVLRRKRRPTLSRSVSEYHNPDYNGHSMSTAEELPETRVQRPVTMHQTSDPLPLGNSTANNSNRGATDSDGSGVPAEANNSKRGATDSDGSGVPAELRELQSFLTSLPSPPSPTPRPLAPSSPSPDTDENTGFQSFLRHKQIRGHKIHISPRAHSASVSSETLSPPAWVNKFAGSPAGDRQAPGGSATLPRRNKDKTGTPRVSKTLDREVHSGSNSPVPPTSSKSSSKTPKIFKRFHRRWQSSSGVKLEQEMIPATISAAATETETTGDFKLPPPMPDKLYLLPAREVAEGLVAMDTELLERITPDEIRDGAWMKRGQKDKLAPNILTMVQSFNQVALLVPTEILGEQTHQQRAKVISSYIQIASKCYYLKNYNSLKAILAGLQSTPVYRLRRSWKDVPSKKRKRFNMLCKLMSEENNWQMYHDELDGCLSTGTPCIPYLGQFLTQVCHQLSYDKMRAERNEVKLRRRSRSFVGVADDHRKEVIQLRRRSNSFHRGSLELGGVGGKRSSVASLSTPVSPLVSEDEHEGASMIVQQARDAGSEEDTQSLEFSLSLDDRVLESSTINQPEAKSTPVDSSSNASSPDDPPNSTARRLSHRQSIMKFHSTPVKDANGYYRPLCAPLQGRELIFDNSPASQGYDEPDFDEGHIEMNTKLQNDDNLVIKELLDQKSSDEENAPFRLKIPSISLQRTSSHSSAEDWVEDEAPVAPGVSLIRKSHSLEAPLGLSLVSGERSRARSDNSPIRASRNRLTLSHSIPSLDSDSVFSVEDEQGEEDGREGEGEGREEEGEGKEREGEGRGGDRNDGRKEEDRYGREEEGELESFDDLQRKKMEQVNDSSLDFSTEDTDTRLTRSLPITTISAISQQYSTMHNEREALFSPVSLTSEKGTTQHSRDQSFSTIETSSLGLSHDARDVSFSPVSEENVDRKDQVVHSGDTQSPPNSLKDHAKGQVLKNRRRHPVQRSRSASNYRHKWRWKKALALANKATTGEKPPSTLNSDPFHLLHVYQMRSRDLFPTTSTSKFDFRTFLGKFSNNSETRNYELSFEREP